jgi:hypothetical protein
VRARASSVLAFAAILVLAAITLATPAWASADDDERALAELYAPDVRLVKQTEECGYGESYTPTDVDVLFDEPTVSLRGPWNTTDLVKIGPAAADLSVSGAQIHPVVRERFGAGSRP